MSSFTLVEDVLGKLKLNESDMPRMLLLKRVQGALGTQVELFGQDYFVNMRSKQYPAVPQSVDQTKHTPRHESDANKKAMPSYGTAQVTMNVTYEEACALSYFREGEIMKGLREISGTAYMPVIVNEVRAMIASEAIMYSTDPSVMLRKKTHEPVSYVDLNQLYGEMSEKMPSLVKIMDFIKHATSTGKRQRDVYSQEKREAVIASILAKSMCTFNSKLDTYKVQLSSLLLNNGTSGEFELDLLAETNDTYPYKQKRKFTARSSNAAGAKNDLVLYKDKDGKAKMVNLYDLVKYDPAEGSEPEEDDGSCPIDTENNPKPFLILTKSSRSRKRRRPTHTKGDEPTPSDAEAPIRYTMPPLGGDPSSIEDGTEECDEEATSGVFSDLNVVGETEQIDEVTEPSETEGQFGMNENPSLTVTDDREFQ